MPPSLVLVLRLPADTLCAMSASRPFTHVTTAIAGLDRDLGGGVQKGLITQCYVVALIETAGSADDYR